jgi:hypothetical protein
MGDLEMGDLMNQAAHSALNWWAIVGASLAAFAIGGLWYSPVLFSQRWMKENGFSEAQLKQGANMGAIMGGALALTFLCAYSVARLMVIGGGWQTGAKVGLYMGAAVAFAIGVDYLFERRSLAHWLINAGHFVVTFVVMGAIIGNWR